MRPKTAMNYNCIPLTRPDFINDKERRQVPGPSDYDASDHAGMTNISKFASTQTGGVIVRS